MSDFWDHIINAAGHLMDANREAQMRAQAERPQRRPKRLKVPAQTSFGAETQPAPAPEKKPCCIGKRRTVKVGE